MESRRIPWLARVGSGLSLVLGPVVLAAGFAIHPAHGDTADAVLQAIVGAPGRWGLAHVLLVVAAALLIPGAIGVRHRLQGSRPGFGLVGAALVGFGAVFLGALVGAEGLAGSALATVPAEQRAGILPGVQAILDGRAALAAVDLGFVAMLGLILLGVGLLAGRDVPRWTGVPVILGALVLAAPISEHVQAIGALVLLVGFGYLGLEGLRLPASTGRAFPANDAEAHPVRA